MTYDLLAQQTHPSGLWIDSSSPSLNHRTVPCVSCSLIRQSPHRRGDSSQRDVTKWTTSPNNVGSRDSSARQQSPPLNVRHRQRRRRRLRRQRIAGTSPSRRGQHRGPPDTIARTLTTIDRLTATTIDHIRLVWARLADYPSLRIAAESE